MNLSWFYKQTKKFGKKKKTAIYEQMRKLVGKKSAFSSSSFFCWGLNCTEQW